VLAWTCPKVGSDKLAGGLRARAPPLRAVGLPAAALQEAYDAVRSIPIAQHQPYMLMP
jgi:hypothetical protein